MIVDHCIPYQGSSDPRSSALRHLMRALVPETMRVSPRRVLERRGWDIHAVSMAGAAWPGVTGSLLDEVQRRPPNEECRPSRNVLTER
jgi:hypothetical protein